MPSFSSISAEPSRKANTPIGHVHEEDPVPVERLRQRAAREQPDRAAAGGDERVHAHRLGLLARLGNSVTMIARITLEATAPPTPCSRRAPISSAWLSARPHSTEAAVNRTRPARNTRLRPTRSPSLPASSRKPAEGDQVAVDHPCEVALGEVQVVLDRRAARRSRSSRRGPSSAGRGRAPRALSSGGARALWGRGLLGGLGRVAHVAAARARRRIETGSCG